MPAKRDLDPAASPLHFFGAEVRRAREAAGMTLADLGATVPCDASTVSRIEAGLLHPTDRFVAACMEAFPQMEWLSRFYEDSRMWGDGAVPRWFEDWLNMELVASTLRTWQPLLIPGLLQTADYARAMYGADMSMRSYICVQVVPSSTGAHAGLSCAFHIASAHGKRDLLYMEAVEGVTEERSALVSKAALIFDLVRSDALARSASRDLILKVAEERWNT